MSDNEMGSTGAKPRAKMPRYIEFHRYEGRVTTRQWRRLTAIRERLTAANGKGRLRDKDLKTERITENFLIRVAVDALLDNFIDGIHGHTEKEISDNVRRLIAKRLANDSGDIQSDLQDT